MKRMLLLLIGVAVLTGTGSAQAARDERASLTGRVSDSSGNPVAAQVQVYQIVIKNGFANIYGKCSSITNSEGRYECPQLPGGKFLVEALPRIKPSQQTPNSSTFPRFVFFPGTSDLEQASMIYLRNTEAGWADIRISPINPGSLSGILPDRTPEAALTLKAAKGDLMVDTGIELHYDGNTGLFSARDIPPGHYIVMADWFLGGAEQRATYPVQIDGAAVDGVMISANPNIEMSGQLLNLTAQAHVSQIHLQRTDGTLTDVTTTVKDGSFRFHPVPPGDYVVTFSPNKDLYVDSVTLNGRGEKGSRISAPADAAATLAVTLKGPAFAIQGTVKPWEANVSRAEVIAQSEDTGEIFETTTDKQRQFALIGLRPGTYRFFAWPGVDSLEYRNPRVLKLYSEDSTEVSVEEGGFAGNVALSPIEKSREYSGFSLCTGCSDSLKRAGY